MTAHWAVTPTLDGDGNHSGVFILWGSVSPDDPRAMPCEFLTGHGMHLTDEQAIDLAAQLANATGDEEAIRGLLL